MIRTMLVPLEGGYYSDKFVYILDDMPLLLCADSAAIEPYPRSQVLIKRIPNPESDTLE